MRNWSKLAGAVALGMALTISGGVSPSSAATANAITVAETTAGGVGVQQIATPWFNSGAISQIVMFRALLRAQPDLVNVKPDLASAYKVSKDGLTVTATLKSGLKWSDGQPLTVDDVVWSINEVLRVAQANAIYINAFKQIVGSEAVSSANNATMSGLTANGNTITMQLKAPTNTMVQVLAQFMILPKHVLENADPLKLHTNNYWKNPVTSGPFKVGTFSQGNFITLVPNDFYEGAKPKITQINVVTSSDLVSDAKAGKIDYFYSNDAETVRAMKQVSTFTSNPVDIAFYRYLVFNLTEANSPFGNFKAREAMKYAVTWNDLIGVMYPNLGKMINSGVTAAMPGHLKSIKGYYYDPAKAKALLKAAKFDFSKTIRLRYYYGDQTSINFMTAVAQQLIMLGMKVEVLKFQGDATTEMLKNRNYDIALKGLSAFNVGEWYGELSSPTTYEAVYGPQPAFAALNTKYLQATTPAERLKVLTALQQLEQKTLFKLPLHSLRQYVFVSKRISGLPAKFGNPLYIYDNNFANWVAKA